MYHQLVLLKHACRQTREQELVTLMVLHDLSLAVQAVSNEMGNRAIQNKGRLKKLMQQVK